MIHAKVSEARRWMRAWLDKTSLRAALQQPNGTPQTRWAAWRKHYHDVRVQLDAQAYSTGVWPNRGLQLLDESTVGDARPNPDSMQLVNDFFPTFIQEWDMRAEDRKRTIAWMMANQLRLGPPLTYGMPPEVAEMVGRQIPRRSGFEPPL